MEYQSHDGTALEIDCQDPETLLEHAKKMFELKQSIHQKAATNITEAQRKDKLYYDKKHSDSRVKLTSYSIL